MGSPVSVTVANMVMEYVDKKDLWTFFVRPSGCWRHLHSSSKLITKYNQYLSWPSGFQRSWQVSFYFCAHWPTLAFFIHTIHLAKMLFIPSSSPELLHTPCSSIFEESKEEAQLCITMGTPRIYPGLYSSLQISFNNWYRSSFCSTIFWTPIRSYQDDLSSLQHSSDFPSIIICLTQRTLPFYWANLR